MEIGNYLISIVNPVKYVSLADDIRPPAVTIYYPSDFSPH